MSKFVFIADYFANDVPGGGEMNNDQVCDILKQKGHEVEKIKCDYVTVDFLEKDANYIIANFVKLTERCKRVLENEKRYIIYEHDHKYVANRNPAKYPGFVIPKNEIINYDFYKNAIAVLCQSKFHQSIAKTNLELDNIFSLGGNLWSEQSLTLMGKSPRTKSRTSVQLWPHKIGTKTLKELLDIVS